MNQFGFRKKYSTFLALMDLVENISKNIDEGNYSIGIFLDLSKAFDTIDHTNVSNIFKINLFADDTSLFHTHDTFEPLIKETTLIN